MLSYLSFRLINCDIFYIAIQNHCRCLIIIRKVVSRCIHYRRLWMHMLLSSASNARNLVSPSSRNKSRFDESPLRIGLFLLEFVHFLGDQQLLFG